MNDFKLAANAIKNTEDKMFSDYFLESSKSLMASSAVEHKPLTVEDLQKTMEAVQREDHFLFIECDYIPDNSKGILLLRKEDMKKMFPHKYKEENVPK